MAERLSIIVPVFNEEARIRAHLETVRDVEGIDEVIVVDGGSTDETCAVVSLVGGCQLRRGPRGRAAQMNAGAAGASGDVFVFLHADVTLPREAARLIRDALTDPEVVAGAFRIRTVAEGRRSWVERWLRLADLRSRYSRLPYGDQALFVRRDAFQRVGGFPAQPLFEDLEMSRRLRRVGRLRILPDVVMVSGRRFFTRPIYFAVVMNVLPVLYRLGVPPSRLARAYPDVRTETSPDVAIPAGQQSGRNTEQVQPLDHVPLHLRPDQAGVELPPGRRDQLGLDDSERSKALA
jgi:rSAM/selenodomain-associated transferase 2